MCLHFRNKQIKAKNHDKFNVYMLIEVYDVKLKWFS